MTSTLENPSNGISRIRNLPLKKHGAWISLVALILLLAFLIRSWHLTKESFWADEGWTMLLSKGPGLSDIVQTMANDQHPPLYFVLMHYWIELTGNSEYTTRFLSLISSLIAVALIYRLGADTFSPEVGALAALLLALADNDTFLARDARHYSQMAMFAVASTLFYLRYFKHGSRTNGIGWLLTSVALMYTHYLGAFILLIQLIHMLLFARPLRKLTDIFFRWVAIGLAWLPWAFVFLEQSLIRYTKPLLSQSAWPNTPEALAIVRGDLIGSHFGLTGGLLVLGLVYVTYTNGVPKFRLRPLWSTMYMLLWLAVPSISIIAINVRFPILTTRNFLLVTPIIALLIAKGIMNLDRFPRILILVILVVVDLITVDAYFVKPPWRQVAQDILQYRLTNEPILMDVWTDEFALQYHIGRDLHADPSTLPLVPLTQWKFNYRAMYYPTLLGYLNGHNSFWLAYWPNEKDDILQWLSDQGYVHTAEQIETHLETNKIYIYHFDKVNKQTSPLASFGDKFDLLSISTEPFTDDNNRREVRVNLLWKVKKAPGVDYSVSAFLLNSAGQSVINDDSSPLNGRAPTSAWQKDELHFDSKTLVIPTTVPAGEYAVGLKIYWYVDQKPLPVTSGASSTPSEYFEAAKMQLGQ